MNKFIEEHYANFDQVNIAEKVNEILSQNLEKNINADVYRKCFSLIDLTSLESTDTEEKIVGMIRKVNDFSKYFADMDNVAAVCVYQNFVETVKKSLQVGINIAAVSAGFPSSQSFIETKIAEVALTVADGANEIDVVQTLSAFLSNDLQRTADDISEIKDACRQAHLKVIIESGILTDEQIQKASLVAIAAGADFIKTSTGKLSPAATLEAAYIICRTIKNYCDKTGKKIGFKAAGGIATPQEAAKYYTLVETILGNEWLNNGLFRIGASRLANNLLSEIYSKEVKYF
ncbi:MAG: deoxyribose-phosphate aldolase [Prevotellaceae bacterium]|jgi:deoxyribose-phosphate aldolase|nr:deoxyribose-phosphate aldolase [Prevotellaceae bacterium]